MSEHQIPAEARTSPIHGKGCFATRAISSEEFTALSLPRQGFAPHDTDHDGQLDAVELERAFLSTSPTDFQDEGRRAVHHKYGHPFGGGPGGRKGHVNYSLRCVLPPCP